MRFVWDTEKAAANLRKYGVSFESARRAFGDPFAIMDQDRIEQGEQRWQTLRMAGDVLLLFVAHTRTDLENSHELVRIISARRATKREWRRYEREAR